MLHPTGRVFAAWIERSCCVPWGSIRGILGWEASGMVLEGSQLLGMVPQVNCPPDGARICPRERELE